MRSLPSLAFILSSAALLAACSSTKVTEDAPINDKSSTGTGASTSQVGTGSAEIDPLNDPNNILSKRSVYFDYDSYAVKEEFRPVVDAHARYLATNKNRNIVIQGNTDARGGAEYNLALGQKRAEAVRRALTLQGVADSQIEAVSFGKEKPKAEGNNEAAWAQNRRADIVY
jgi:peptidoglycan-associated lipoprotein